MIFIGIVAGILTLQQGGFGRAQTSSNAYGVLGDTNPAWSPTGELIAFVSTRDLKPEIYVMNADGKVPRRLTTSPAGMASSMPAWSPNSRLIVFVIGMLGASQISVMNADGSNQKPLVSGQGNDGPAWSPDGRKIAFVSNRTGRDGVYVIGAEGGQPAGITSELPSASSFSWSPDSKRIAFGTWVVELGPSRANDCGTFDILTVTMHTVCRVYVVGADGRNPRTLTTSAEIWRWPHVVP